MAVSACAWLSRRLPARIVCCSNHARDRYAAHGFEPGKMTVIPNGFDTDVFRPDPPARWAIRRELSIDPAAPVIGLVARYDPLKDHETFLRAAALLAARQPEVRFLLCGDRVDRGNTALSNRVDELGLAPRCHLLGPKRDVARIYAALDVATSSSISEAFPLVLGEAMACGVPCVATDVGDSALIVGPAGRIVPPRNPDALAAAWAELLDLGAAARAGLGAAGRARVRELFDLDSVTRRYEALYEDLLGVRRVRDYQPLATQRPARSRSTN
jgi:glycosyltransferase involved in cell wall biosynthesis